ncbi:MAG: hypothetical protein V1813_02905 [Candidatus Aenigmatarchaeota archaeon]
MKFELAGIVTIALMFTSLAGMVVTGMGNGLVPLALFSISLSIAIVLFGTWFTDGKPDGK